MAKAREEKDFAPATTGKQDSFAQRKAKRSFRACFWNWLAASSLVLLTLCFALVPLGLKTSAQEYQKTSLPVPVKEESKSLQKNPLPQAAGEKTGKLLGTSPTQAPTKKEEAKEPQESTLPKTEKENKEEKYSLSAAGDPPPQEKKASPSLGESSAPVREVPSAGKRIALTFDDGPFPNWTAKYLKLLADQEVKATFFLVGKQVSAHPQLAAKITAAGHEAGSHSYAHSGLLAKKKPEAITEELNLAAETITKATGQAVSLFRPPYGNSSPAIVEAAAHLGQKSITWSIDPRDWRNPSPEKLTEHVLSHAKDGAIVLLHEGRSSTYAALPQIIAGLKKRGYELVPVSVLLSPELLVSKETPSS